MSGRLATMVAAEVWEKLSNDEKQQQEVVHELVDTEKQYIEDMEMLVRTFITPVVVQGLLTAGEMGRLCQNLERLVEVNREFLSELEKLKGTDDSPHLYKGGVGGVFAAKGDLFKMYAVYCPNQPYIVPTMTEYKDKKKEFAAFCKTTNQQACLRGLPLESYLSKPVQRLCKYPLLLRELVKTADPDSTDRTLLDEASSKVKDVVDKVNERTRQVENVMKIKELEQSFQYSKKGDDRIENFVTRTRRFVRESVLKECERAPKGRSFLRGDDISVLLFNDMLILARENKKYDAEAHKAKGEKYKEKKYVFLRAFKNILDVGARPNAEDSRIFDLVVGKGIEAEVLFFGVSTPTERDDWIGAINGVSNAARDDEKSKLKAVTDFEQAKAEEMKAALNAFKPAAPKRVERKGSMGAGGFGSPRQVANAELNEAKADADKWRRIADEWRRQVNEMKRAQGISVEPEMLELTTAVAAIEVKGVSNASDDSVTSGSDGAAMAGGNGGSSAGGANGGRSNSSGSLALKRSSSIATELTDGLASSSSSLPSLPATTTTTTTSSADDVEEINASLDDALCEPTPAVCRVDEQLEGINEDDVDITEEEQDRECGAAIEARRLAVINTALDDERRRRDELVVAEARLKDERESFERRLAQHEISIEEHRRRAERLQRTLKEVDARRTRAADVLAAVNSAVGELEAKAATESASADEKRKSYDDEREAIQNERERKAALRRERETREAKERAEREAAEAEARAKVEAERKAKAEAAAAEREAEEKKKAFEGGLKAKLARQAEEKKAKLAAEKAAAEAAAASPSDDKRSGSGKDSSSRSHGLSSSTSSSSTSKSKAGGSADLSLSLPGSSKSSSSSRSPRSGSTSSRGSGGSGSSSGGGGGGSGAGGSSGGSGSSSRSSSTTSSKKSGSSSPRHRGPSDDASLTPDGRTPKLGDSRGSGSSRSKSDKDLKKIVSKQHERK